MKKLLYFIFLSCSFLHAQRPNIVWEKSFGGSDDDRGVSICKKTNGQYLVLVDAHSSDGDVNSHLPTAGSSDYWLCTIDSLGNLINERSYGGTSGDHPYEIIPVRNGGFIMCGYTGSDDIDVSGNHSWSTDIWLTKMDDSLNIEWQKCLGSTLFEYGFHVSEAADSGYFFQGNTYGNDGDVSGNHGDLDCWLGKVDQNGNLLWQICLGTPDIDGSASIISTSDGGVLFVGGTTTGAGSYCTSPPAGLNVWIVKVDANGNIDWEKCLGSSSDDIASNVISDKQAGYYVAGLTLGNNGDVTGYHGNGDIWVLHIDSLGNLLWQNCFGGPDHSESPGALAITPDGGIVVCGYSNSATVHG